MKSITCLALAGAFFASNQVHGAIQAPTSSAQAPADRADSILRKAMTDRKIPGLQAAVIANGKVVFSRNYGVANMQTPVPVTDDTVFSINSVTKAFTGIAVMQEVEKGKLDLSAPISTYLADIPSSWGKVTVRQLMGQISGLPDIDSYGEDAEEIGVLHEDRAWEWALTQAPSAPGELENYNQTNLALAQRIVNRLEGRPPDGPIINKELAIAGMTETSFGDSRDATRNKTGEYVYRYAEHDQIGVLGNEVIFFGPMLHAGSGLNSTAKDMTRWMQSILSGEQLSEASQRVLWTPVLLNNGSPSSFAIGWDVASRNGYTKVGMIGGERAVFSLYPQFNAGVVILSNLRGSNPEELADEVAALFVPEVTLTAVEQLRAAAERSDFTNLEELIASAKAQNNPQAYDEEELVRWVSSLLWGGGKAARAVTVAQFAVAMFPQSNNALEGLARAYEANAQPVDANQTFRLLLARDPLNRNAKLYLNVR